MECQAAFEKLKQLFIAEPVLKHLNPNAPFVMQADARNTAVGLYYYRKMNWGLYKSVPTLQRNPQKKSGEGQYGKKKLTQYYGHWRHFLKKSKIPFEVWTDHKNLDALKPPRKLSTSRSAGHSSLVDSTSPCTIFSEGHNFWRMLYLECHNTKVLSWSSSGQLSLQSKYQPQLSQELKQSSQKLHLKK